MTADYPTEPVECPRCNGSGEVEVELDLFAMSYGRCLDCAGTGWVDVCVNCGDDFNGCSVCCPSEHDSGAA